MGLTVPGGSGWPEKEKTVDLLNPSLGIAENNNSVTTQSIMEKERDLRGDMAGQGQVYKAPEVKVEQPGSMFDTKALIAGSEQVEAQKQAGPDVDLKGIVSNHLSGLKEQSALGKALRDIGNPKQFANTLYLQSQTGNSLSSIKRNPEKVKEEIGFIDRLKNVSKRIDADPTLKAAVQDPSNLAIFADNPDVIAVMTQQSNSPWAKGERTSWLQSEHAKIGGQIYLQGGQPTPEQKHRLGEIETELQNNLAPKSDNGFLNLGSEMLHGMRSQGYILEAMGPAAAVNVTGKVADIGLKAAAPFTGPLAPVTAGAGTVINAGTTWTSRYMAADAIFTAERNSMVASLATVTDSEGNHLDGDVVKLYSNAYGGVSASLEYVSYGKLASLLPGKESILKRLGKGYIKETLLALAKNPITYRKIVSISKNYVRKVAEGAATEGLTEALQEVASIMAEDGAFSTQEERTAGTTGATFERPTFSDKVDRVYESGRMGALVGGGMVGSGSLIGAANDYKSATKATAGREVFNMVGENIKGKLKDTFEANPQATGDLIQKTMFEKQGFKEMSISAKDFQNILGAESRAFAQKLDLNPDDIQRAADHGQDIKIPIGKAIGIFGNTPYYQEITDNSRLGEDGMTAKEAAEYDESLEKPISREITPEMLAKEKKTQDSWNRLYQSFGLQIQQAGRPKTEADAAAKIFADSTVAQAARIGVEPEEYAAKRPLVVVKRKDPKVTLADRMANSSGFKLGGLSAEYESSGDPGTISSGAGDSGGVSYGTWQLASTYGKPEHFVEWLGNKNPKYREILRNAGAVNSEGFKAAWRDLAKADREGFNNLQYTYIKEHHYDPGVKYLKDRGFDITQRSKILNEVLWSNGVQHGPETGASAFIDAAKNAGKDINSMTDEEIIRGVYGEKINNGAWSSGALSADVRQSLLNRWNNEMNKAIDALHGQEGQVYGQPITENLDLDGSVESLDMTSAIHEAVPHQKDITTMIRELAKDGVSIPRADLDMIVKLPESSNKAKHIAFAKPMAFAENRQVAGAAINNIVDVVGRSTLVEISPRKDFSDQGERSQRYKGDIENYIRFFVPVKMGESNYTLMVTAEEAKGQINFNPKNVTLYEITPFKQKRASVAHAQSPEGGQRLLSTEALSNSNITPSIQNVNKKGWGDKNWKRTQEGRPAQLVQEAAPDTLTIRDMLAGLKDVDGVPYINEDGSGNFNLGDTYNQQNRGQVEFTAQGKRIISLFKERNASTVIHEAGHVYLENMSEDVLEPGATEQLKADFKTACDWLGVTKDQIKNGRVQFTVEQHEKFARGFERYLAEGKAPSANLRKVFRDFKRWLLKIYNNVMHMEEITPEVRQVFDRLLATEEQIQELKEMDEYFEQKKVQVKQLLDSLGDEKAAKIYRELDEEATGEAEEKLGSVTMEDLDEERTQWLKKKRLAVEKEIEENLRKNHPVYRVLNYLETAPENQKIKTGSFTGDLADVLVSEKGGVTAEDFAIITGFESVEEMAIAFASAVPLKDALTMMTNKEMATYEAGILARPQEMEESGQEALYNDKKVDTVAAELEILDRVTEKEKAGEGRFEKAKEALRQYRERATIARNTAKMIIGGTVLREVSPRGYVMKARLHAGKAMRYIQLGKMEQAAREKDRELLNAALANEAYKTLQERDKVIRSMKQLNKKKADIGFTEDYVKPIQALIHAYRMIPPSKSPLVPEMADLSEVVAFMKKQAGEKGFDIDLPEWMETGVMTQKDYRDLPTDKFRDVYKFIKQIEHLGKEEGKGKKTSKFNDFQDKLGQVVETIYQNNKSAQRGAFEKTKESWVNDLHYSHSKIEFMTEKLDGYEEMGTCWQAIFQPLADAGGKQFTMMADYRRNFKRIIEKHFGGNLEAEVQKEYEITSPNGDKHALTGEEMLAMALNWGNEDNRDRVLQGLKQYGITKKEIENFFDENMTEAHWEFAKDVWSMIDSYWPEIAALYREWTGATPAKVMPAPILTKYGIVSGGYYPIVYDPNSTKHAKMQEEKEAAAEILGPQFVTASTRNGHTKARSGFAGGRILLELDVIDRHVTNVIQDLSYGRAVVEINQLVSNSEFEDAIKNTLGPEAYKQFRPWLVGVARPDPPVANFIEKISKRIRMGTTIANMGYKVTTALVQPLGATMTVPDLGAMPVISALTGFYKDFMINHSKADELIEFVKSKSAFMAERASTFDRDIRDTIKELSKSGKLSPIYKYAFHMASMADLAITIPLWNEAYNQGMSKFKGNEADAIRYADKIIRQTQGSGNRMDLSNIQRGSEMMKIFTMHYSFFNVLYNSFGKQWGKYRSGKMGFVEFATAISWVWIVSAAIEPLMKTVVGKVLGAISGDDDELDPKELAVDIAMNILKYPAGAVIGLRDIANAVGPSGSRYGYKMSPVMSTYESVVGLGNALGDADAEKMLKNAWRAGGTWYALPVRQTEASVGEILNWILKDKDFSLKRFFLGGK